LAAVVDAKFSGLIKGLAQWLRDRIFAVEEMVGQKRLIAGFRCSNFGRCHASRRCLRVRSAGVCGDDEVFRVDQRVGLKVASQNFGIGGHERRNKACRRFLSVELWMFLPFTQVAASGVGWRQWW
jgi:hypothetical protein